MTATERILTYASMKGQPFRKRDLLDSLGTQIVSEATANVLLSRLVEQGKLVKVGHGLYSLAEKGKQSFLYMPSEDEKEFARIIKEKFPFAEFCIWKPSVLIPYMRHIPALGMTFVDVERTAMESVFFFLQGAALEIPILLNPTPLEIERYITQVSHLLNLMDIKGYLGILRDIWGRYLCQNGIGPKRHTSLKIS